MKKNDKSAQDEGRKTQSADAVREDFEIEESNAMRVLRGTGEENTNPHESRIEGRKISRAENFWYRHKWHAGLTLCGIAIAVVVLIQIITHVKPDLYIMYRYDKLEAAITSVMEDTNGDGKTAISFADNTYLSADQIDAKKAATSGTFRFDYQSNNAAFQRYTTEITAGKHMFVMLDPALHDQMASAGAFVPLDEIFGGEIPASAYGDYGIRLGDTEFYKSDPDINFLPADTVLAVRIPAALDFKSDEKKAEYAEPYKELLRSIAEYVPEKSGN